MISGTLSTSSTSALQTTDRTQKSGMAQNFKKLESALKSGDLDAAKAAYSAIEDEHSKQTKSSSSSSSSSTDSAKSGSDEMEKLMSKVGDALNSGDLSAAQTAFSSVQSTMKAHRPQGGPPPGGHRPDNDGDGDNSSSFQSTDNGVGGTLNIAA